MEQKSILTWSETFTLAIPSDGIVIITQSRLYQISKSLESRSRGRDGRLATVSQVIFKEQLRHVTRYVVPPHYYITVAQREMCSVTRSFATIRATSRPRFILSRNRPARGFLRTRDTNIYAKDRSLRSIYAE